MEYYSSHCEWYHNNKCWFVVMIIKITNDSVEGISIDNADSDDSEHDVGIIKNVNKNDGDNVYLHNLTLKLEVTTTQ